MPVYEFYCLDCHTIYNFLSRRVNTEKKPDCPKCDRRSLDRRMSMFSISKGRNEDFAGDDDLPDIDEARLERAMESLAGEMEAIDEDDPKAMGRVMRKLYDATGMKLGDAMEEAVRRMEAGEDPDRIEEEMGDVLEGEDPFGLGGDAEGDDGGKMRWKALKRRMLPPSVDETLYEL